MSRVLVLTPALLLSLLAGCSGPQATKSLGEAYVGPAALKLRQDLGLHSLDGPTLRHGQHVEIVGQRRRFVKVRTAQGAEGWTDMRQLLAAEQMEDLDRLAERAASLPSQGAASVYEPLNVHTEPNRQAPSFYRIAAKKEAVDVVGHELAPRIPYDAPDLIPKRPKVVRIRKPKKEDEGFRLRPPEPPSPPSNWLELSKTPSMPELPEPPPPPPPKPVRMDDWSLVRLKNGRAGWVLTGMLRMNIPDEVAQYAEGHRITSYFAMASVTDNGQTKHHWLWTTLSETSVPYEFDSFRYFIWSLRHHRYETAYVQRNVKGHFPIEVHPVDVMIGKKMERCPGFSLILEEEDGTRYRCTYAYEIYLVKLVEKTKLPPPATPEAAPQVQPPPESEPTPQAKPPIYQRVLRNVAELPKKWFGK